MKKETMKAKVRYYKEDQGKEGYAISIFDGDTWETSVKFPLVARENGNGEKDFVFFGILSELSQLQRLGYAIDLQL